MKQIKHVIIGTAGHVDHGKTQLVKALTGIDTDTLPEEKRRGLTIEPGFSHLLLGDAQLGIIDVPGHEKFIKNMLAGSGGIDAALLVVAADEGVMPQTIEHVQLLSLLGIKDGVIALTKCDIADKAQLQRAYKQLETLVKGTFLENSAVIETSARTGLGIEALKNQLGRLAQRAAVKDESLPFRMHIDRAFSLDGFGTVATGTLIEGCIRLGETAELLPLGQSFKVRSLQVYGQYADIAHAGQRAAVNLAGAKKEDAKRGDTLISPGALRPSELIDVRLCALEGSKRTIAQGSRVHFYHGAKTLLARVKLLDRAELLPGKSCLAQLRLDAPIAAKRGDRFAVRFYSPLETLGGGVILDERPAKHKRFDENVLEALAAMESGDIARRLAQALAEAGIAMPGAAALAKKLGVECERAEAELAQLTEKGGAYELDGRYVAASVLQGVWARGRALLEDYHAKAPLQKGMKCAELLQKLGTDAQAPLLGLFEKQGRVKLMGSIAALPGFSPAYTKKQLALREALLENCLAAGFEAQSIDKLSLDFAKTDRADCKRVLSSLVEEGELLALPSGAVLHRSAYERAKGILKTRLDGDQTLKLAQFRDALGVSRSRALDILELLDRRGLTVKTGDVRIAGPLL